MDDNQKNALIEAGYDLQNALARFVNNETLYMTFLLKYPDEENYSLIAPNIESENYEEAYKAAHALKGIAGNLGLTDVFESSKELLALIKDKTAADGIKEEAQKAYEDLKEKHEKAVNIIRSFG